MANAKYRYGRFVAESTFASNSEYATTWLHLTWIGTNEEEVKILAATENRQRRSSDLLMEPKVVQGLAQPPSPKCPPEYQASNSHLTQTPDIIAMVHSQTPNSYKSVIPDSEHLN